MLQSSTINQACNGIWNLFHHPISKYLWIWSQSTMKTWEIGWAQPVNEVGKNVNWKKKTFSILCWCWCIPIMAISWDVVLHESEKVWLKMMALGADAIKKQDMWLILGLLSSEGRIPEIPPRILARWWALVRSETWPLIPSTNKYMAWHRCFSSHSPF